MLISPVPFHVERFISKIWGLLKFAPNNKLIIEYQTERLRHMSKIQTLEVPVQAISDLHLTKGVLMLQTNSLSVLGGLNVNAVKQGRCYFQVAKADRALAECFVAQMKIKLEEARFDDCLA